MAESRGYRAEIGWRDADDGGSGQFEALLLRARECAGDPLGDVDLCVSGDGADRPWRDYANDPLGVGDPSDFSRRVREALRERLPETYVPSAVLVLDRLPMSPNGKVDRAALPEPEPDHRGPGRTGGPSAPRTPWQRRLAQIWCDVLRVDEVGIHDNFFELGGDSILSIQIIARASQAGIKLTPAQMFQHQTIAGLSAIADEGAPASSNAQGPISGPIIPTPIQRWFFEQGLEEPHHFNQAVLIPVPAYVAYAPLERVFAAIVAHHDALRLRFEGQEADWRTSHEDPDGRNVTVAVQDLSMLAAEERGAAIRESSGRLQASLNLAEGPLIRVKVFTSGPAGPAYLLIVIHHVVTDGISWRILFEDLATALGQIGRGEEIRLPAKSASYKDWAENLAAAARSEEIRREADYWLGATAEPDSLPVDFPWEVNRVASARDVTVTLGAGPTRSLLQDVHSAYRTQINDFLLTALVRTFSAWTGRPSLLIDLEGHGREDVPGAPDVSRTVGWFTSLFPLELKVGSHATPAEDLKAVKEQLRRIPRHGVGYGLLRYLAGDEDLSRRLAELPRAAVAFNYLGQFGGSGLEASGDEVDPSWCGPNRSPRGGRRHLIEVNAGVARDALSVTWTYAENIHRRETIEWIAGRFLDELGMLIAHCQSPGAGGYTPSDFANAGLGQEELDRFLAGIDQPRKATRRPR
jgi:non-ribosomal peptide synthase protein (TIGR01720 family)